VSDARKYSKVLGISLPPDKPPHSNGNGIVVQGPGWRAAVPLGVLVGLIAAAGSIAAQRAVPDAALRAIDTQLQIKALEDANFRDQVRRDLAAIQQQINRNDHETRNRFVVLEARLQNR
jgi:hypothetical protein